MNCLKQYLIQARKFNTPFLRALVIGNPSADMDSVVGATALSWYYGYNNKLKYSPVINC